MKQCSRCKETKDNSAFWKKGATSLQSQCRACSKEVNSSRYRRFVERERQRLAKVRKDGLAKFKKWLEEVKAVPCADCGIRYNTWVMDFDHVRGTKAFNIGSAAGFKRERLEEEVAKCDVVCANCHRDRTHKRFMATKM